MLKNGIDIFYYYESIWNTSSFIINYLDKKIGYLIKYFVISELIKQKDYLSKQNKEALISYIQNVKEIKNSSSDDELLITYDYYINFVQNIYNKVYKEDLEGKITLQTAQKFILSADMIEVFKIFNLFDYQLQRLQQFCRYKSKIIDDLLKKGKKPPSGGLKDFIYNPENDMKYFIQFNKLHKRRNSEDNNFISPLNNNIISNNNQNINKNDQIKNDLEKNESNNFDEIPNDPYSLTQNNNQNINNNNNNINENNISNNNYKGEEIINNKNIYDNNINTVDINKIHNDINNIDINNSNDINYNINNNNNSFDNQDIENISYIPFDPSSNEMSYLNDMSLLININNLNNCCDSHNNDNIIQRSNTVPLQNINTSNILSKIENYNEKNTNFYQNNINNFNNNNFNKNSYNNNINQINNNNNNHNNNHNNNINNITKPNDFYLYNIPSLSTSSSTKKMYINKSDESNNNQYSLDKNLINHKKNEIIINNKKAIEDLKYKSIDTTIKILQNSISLLKKFPKTK